MKEQSQQPMVSNFLIKIVQVQEALSLKACLSNTLYMLMNALYKKRLTQKRTT